MEWFKRWFGEEYLLVYNHRTHEQASQESESIAKLLNLRPGERILDLCCGNGRHSINFSSSGLRVVGFDYSECLLNQANRENSTGISLVRGDVRSLPFREGSFDVVVNLFTSFGYFSNEENEKMIEDIALVLRLGGKFLLDYLNPEFILSNLVPASYKKPDCAEITEKRRYDPTTHRIEKTILIKEKGGEKEFFESVRLYSSRELISMIESKGFRIKGIFGDYTGVPFTTESERMVIYSKKI